MTNYLIKHFDITEDERNQLTSGGKQSKFDAQVRWAVSELRQALLLENSSSGVFKITPRGLETLKENPPIIDSKFLRKFPEFQAWIKSTDHTNKIYKKKVLEEFNPKFGLVSYIDMLGTKDFWKNFDPRGIPDTWNKFTKQLQDLLQQEFTQGSQMNFNSFSDTIIITLENDDINDLLKKFGKTMWSSITQSIKLDIPIRGCFSIGSFYNEKNFFIGEAVTDAAQYYELPQWIGISASPSANVKIEKLSKADPTIRRYYHKCSIPLKHSLEHDAWAIKWPALYDASNIGAENDESFVDILELIDKNLEKIKNVDAVLKWRNTKKFYNDVTGNS